MLMKKAVLFFLAFCLLLAGCAQPQTNGSDNTAPTVDPVPVVTENPGTVDVSQPEDTRTITPLPDTTMENLTDAILSVSLGEENTYVDEDGHTQMELKIYAYDQYDMVDIASLKVGDTIVRHAGEVKVISLERKVLLPLPMGCDEKHLQLSPK